MDSFVAQSYRRVQSAGSEWRSGASGSTPRATSSRAYDLLFRVESQSGYTGTSPRTCVRGMCGSRGRFLTIRPFAPREVLAGKDARTLARELLFMTQAEFSAAFKNSPMERAKLRGLKSRRGAAVRAVPGDSGPSRTGTYRTRGSRQRRGQPPVSRRGRHPARRARPRARQSASGLLSTTLGGGAIRRGRRARLARRSRVGRDARRCGRPKAR